LLINLGTLLFAPLNYMEHLINEIKIFTNKSTVINFTLIIFRQTKWLLQ